jgi:hypothetical protein
LPELLDSFLELRLIRLDPERMFPGGEGFHRVPGLQITLTNGIEDIQVGPEMGQIILVEGDGLNVFAQGLTSPTGGFEEIPLPRVGEEGLGGGLDPGVLLEFEKEPREVEGKGGRVRVAADGRLEVGVIPVPEGREGQALGFDEVMDEAEPPGTLIDADQGVALNIVGRIVDFDDVLVPQELIGDME